MGGTLDRRSFLLRSGGTVLGVSGLAGVLSACGGGSESGPPRVEVWSQLQGAEAQSFYRKEVVEAFKKAHPDIEIAVSFKNADDINRLVGTALQSGDGPDLVPTGGPSSAIQFAQANMFQPLDEYASKYDWESKILPWALDFGKIDGKLLTLPNEFETMLLFYNRTVFEREGWKPPATRDELEALAEEMTAKDITPFAAGTADFAETLGWFVTVFFNHCAGPEAIKRALTGEIPWTDAAFVDSIALLADYFERGWFGGGSREFLTAGFDKVHGSFGEGSAGMLMEGTWFLEEIDGFFGKEGGNDNEWDWAPLPALGPGVAPELFELGIGSTVSISRDSEQADATATFLNWYYSEPKRVGERIAAVPGRMNIPINIAESDFPSTVDPRVARVLAVLSDATSEGNYGYTAWTFWPPKSYQYLYEKMQDVLVGELTPEQYCAGLDEQFREELEAKTVPPII